jgi:hypothetical protein
LARSPRQLGRAETVFQRLDGHGDEIADLGFDFAMIVLEFFDRNQALGFEAGVDGDEVAVDINDFSGDDFALTHFLAGEGFLEQRREIFHGGGVELAVAVDIKRPSIRR